MSISQNFPTIEPSLNLSFALTKKLDPRITFARASDAVYYDGITTAKAEENLQIRSQTFVNWTSRDSATKTDNQAVAPDGTTTSGQIVSVNSVSTEQLIYFSHTGAGTFIAGSTISCFFKAGTSNIAFIQGREGGNPYAVYDLSTQTLLGSSGGTASLVDVGSGWYRIILSNLTVGANYFVIGGKDSYTSGAPWGNGTWTSGNTILVWGAQLEQRSAVTAYTPTTTQPITNYIPTLLTAPANVARFDHNPITTESLGFLVEEQRTNLVTYSEDFANAVYSKVNSAITSNINVAPDGTLTADSLIENSTASELHYMTRTVTTTGAHSYSIYAKQNGRQYIVLIGYSGPVSLTNGAVFDLNAGVVVSTGANLSSASITSVGNGWYRCQIVGTALLRAPQLHLMSNATTFTYTGDGYSGIYIWGAQLEAGAFPTSYIKTVASQVTRASDSASMTGSNFSEWYRQDEGTLYTDFAPVGVPTASWNYWFSLNSSSSNSIAIRQFGANTNNYRIDYNGTAQCATDIGASFANVYKKVGVVYKFNDIASVYDGSNLSLDSLANIPDSTQFNIGFLSGVAVRTNLWVKKIAYYPQRLTNTQLQALTS